MNSRGISPLITQNRLLSQARSRSKSGSIAAALVQSSSSGTSSTLAEALKKASAGSSSLSEADQSQKEAYTVIKKTAANIQQRAEKLLSLPEKSIDEMTEEEKSDYKKTVLDEISSLITEYNDMMTGMEDAGGKVNEIYISQMKGYFQNASKQLAELGITENAKGKLTLDQEKFANADAAAVKEILGEKETFIDDIGKRAENVLANAETNLAVINKSLYAGNYTYNQYGSDIFDILTSGSKYNSIG